MSFLPISFSQKPGDPSPVLVPPLQRVAAGEFGMGANADDKFTNDTERPRHRVTLGRDFYLGVYPVTVAEYRSFQPDYAPAEPERWPAVGMSWQQATEYCAWLGEMTGDAWRLPTEAEWEYAARAGSSGAYPWGEEITVRAANYYYDEQGHRIGPGHRTEVGVYSPNAFGLHDLHGNVGEWVQDRWHPTYDGAPADGAAWLDDAAPGEDRRVLRGGAWDYLPRLLRSCWRDALAETAHRDNLGFRAACDLAPAPSS